MKYVPWAESRTLDLKFLLGSFVQSDLEKFKYSLIPYCIIISNVVALYTVTIYDCDANLQTTLKKSVHPQKRD